MNGRMDGRIRAPRKRAPRTPLLLLAGLCIAIILCCTPCLAVGYIYLDTGEQPDLAAHAEGTTRYYPGDSFQMTVILTNKERDTELQIAPALSPGAYDPSTALGVTVRPSAGDAPVTIKSLPAMVGDIGSWDRVPVTLQGTVHQNATPGVHTILLNVSYTYVYAIPVVGPDYGTIEMLYRSNEQTLPVPFRVNSEVRPAVLGEQSENLFPGTQGYLIAEVANAGYATGTEVSLRLVPADNTTFQMVADSVYLPRFAPGEVVPLKVQIAVKEHTGAGSYPATIEGQYKDADGIFRAMPSVPIGIPVSRGPVIETLTRNVTIGPGGNEIINLTFYNSGDMPATDAQARVIGNSVVMTVDDSAALGTLAPGERKSARFSISATTAIPGKQYVISSEVKYWDGLGALVLSDPMSVGVDIVQPKGLDVVLYNPAYLVLIGGVIVLLAYAGWKPHGREKGKI